MLFLTCHNFVSEETILSRYIMKKFRAMSVLLIFITTSLQVEASCQALGCTAQVSELYISGTSDGRIFIKPSVDPNGIVQCNLAEGKYFTLKKTHELQPELYSALLTAQVSQKTIFMRILEDTSGCELMYIKMGL